MLYSSHRWQRKLDQCYRQAKCLSSAELDPIPSKPVTQSFPRLLRRLRAHIEIKLSFSSSIPRVHSALSKYGQSHCGFVCGKALSVHAETQYAHHTHITHAAVPQGLQAQIHSLCSSSPEKTLPASPSLKCFTQKKRLKHFFS